jgi:hypothetical protein
MTDLHDHTVMSEANGVDCVSSAEANSCLRILVHKRFGLVKGVLARMARARSHTYPALTLAAIGHCSAVPSCALPQLPLYTPSTAVVPDITLAR